MNVISYINGDPHITDFLGTVAQRRVAWLRACRGTRRLRAGVLTLVSVPLPR